MKATKAESDYIQPGKIHFSFTVDRITWENYKQKAETEGITVSECVVNMFWYFTKAREVRMPVFTRETNIINRAITCTIYDINKMKLKKAWFGLSYPALFEAVWRFYEENSNGRN